MKDKTRILFILFVFFCFAISSIAQEGVHIYDTTTTNKKPTLVHIIPQHAPKPVTHEFSLGFRLNTDGWSIYTDFGKSKAVDEKHIDRFYNLKFWQIEFSEKKDPHELKSTSTNVSPSGGSSTYIFGKVNNFYTLKPALGFRKMIAGKPDDNGVVSIHWVNTGGIAIGILKPYYINVAGDPAAIKYNANTKNDFLNSASIAGSAGFNTGINELTVVPGLHYKSVLHFDFSGSLNYIIAIETGVNIEYYLQDVQIMATQSSSPAFVDIFLAFQFGKRW